MKRVINYNNTNQIRQIGFKVLSEELGVVGLISFLKQFDNGYGDYTKEREKALDNISINDIIGEINKI